MTPPLTAYTIGGVVSGLSSTTGRLWLQNNGSNNLLITANGNFTFGEPVVGGATCRTLVRYHLVRRRFPTFGVVFALTPGATNAMWSEAPLYRFGVAPKDGINPMAGLIFDAAGNLYGTHQEEGLTQPASYTS